MIRKLIDTLLYHNMQESDNSSDTVFNVSIHHVL